MTKFISALLVSASAIGHGSELPLTVDQVVTGAGSHVRVTNTGNQPITAWSLAAIASQGDRTHREVYTADAYLSEVTQGLPGSSDLLNRLQPGEARDLPLDPLPAGARVEVLAVVLNDGTAAGDEQILAAIFDKRMKERDALHAVMEAFDDVLATRHGPAALDALKERLTALVRENEAVPCRAALDAVETYASGSDPDKIDQSLKTYSAFVAREYELAARHARRRTS
jgi:hypothetical protein